MAKFSLLIFHNIAVRYNIAVKLALVLHMQRYILLTPSSTFLEVQYYLLMCVLKYFQ